MKRLCKKFFNLDRKTNLQFKKIKSCICAVILAGIMSSYSSAPPESSSAFIIKNNWAEYSKVQQFIYENICVVMEKQITAKPKQGSATKYFSRCPSGYESQIKTVEDSVKTDRYVSGKIVYYKGCNSIYVCDFKVCMATNFIMLRSSGKDYTSLSAFIDSKNSGNKTIVKN